MLIFGIIFNLIGLGFFCWLMFALAAHALPVFAAVTIGLAAFHSGAGPAGAIMVALVSGVVTLFIGQIAFATARSPLIRAAIATLFAAPAVVAGYHVALGLADFGASSDDLARSFRVDRRHRGGATAWARISLYATPNFETAACGRPQIMSPACRRSGIGELAANLLLNAVPDEISSSNLTPKSCDARRRFHRAEPSAPHEERHVRRSNRCQSGSRRCAALPFASDRFFSFASNARFLARMIRAAPISLVEDAVRPITTNAASLMA